MSANDQKKKKLVHRCIPRINPKPELGDIAILGLRSLKSHHELSEKEAMDGMRLLVELAVLKRCQGRARMRYTPRMSAWIEMMWNHKEVDRRYIPEQHLETWSSRTKNHSTINIATFSSKPKNGNETRSQGRDSGVDPCFDTLFAQGIRFWPPRGLGRPKNAAPPPPPPRFCKFLTLGLCEGFPCPGACSQASTRNSRIKC